VKTVIRGGTVVTGAGETPADVVIDGETISALVAPGTAVPSAGRTVDASGAYVLPGTIDPHVHFNDEFMGTVSVHDYDHGTRAAAFGGVTSVIDFVNQRPAEPVAETIARKKDEAAGAAFIDHGIHVALTDSSPATLQGIGAAVAAGVTSFKCYMTYREEGLLLEDHQIFQIMGAIGAVGGVTMIHAEDNTLLEARIAALEAAGRSEPADHPESRPLNVEDAAVRRVIELAQETGARLYVVHMSSPAAVAMIRDAAARGVDAYAETCTHFLAFDETALSGPEGPLYICNPPLRDPASARAIMDAVVRRQIDVVASDDAAYTYEAKHRHEHDFARIPAGLPGVELRLPVLYDLGVATGRMTMSDLVRVLSEAPARIFGLGAKGLLLPGYDADLVVFDPGAPWTPTAAELHSPLTYGAYDGRELRGRVRSVLSRGEVIVDGKDCLGVPGRGRFLARTPARRTQ
jgi:dihydropyrimidinase